jgi:hypothetical protein
VIFGSLFDNEISFPVSMVVLEDKNSLGMGIQILLRQIDFGSFLMVAAKMIVLAIVSGLSTVLIKLFGYFSLAYCVGNLSDVD